MSAIFSNSLKKLKVNRRLQNNSPFLLKLLTILLYQNYQLVF